MTTQIKAGVIAANAVNSSELASGALSGQNFTGDVAFDTTTLKIDSSNNRVGIGTTSPNVTLTLSDGTDEFDFGVTTNQLLIKSVTSDGSDDQKIIIDAGSGGLSSTRGAYILLAGNEAASEPGHAIYQMGNVSGSSHVFRKAGGIDAVTIDSSGNVGIGTGTSSPASELHVKSSGTSSDTLTIENSTGNGSWKVKEGSSSNALLQGYNASNSETIRLDPTSDTFFNGGNVGIGTDSPDTMLHLSAGSTGVAGGGDAAITMTNKFDNPDNSWKIAPVRTGVSNTGLEIRDVTDSRTDMVFDGTGNVGIGQSAPASTLHIGDGASHYVRIENAGSGDVSSGYQIYRGSSVGMSLYDNPADNTTSLLCAGSLNINAGGSGADLHVNTNGKVGIGTTSVANILQIAGAIGLDHAAMRSAGTTGDFSITVGELPTLSSNAWKDNGMLVFYTGVDGSLANANMFFSMIRVRGLSTYASAVVSNIVGTATISDSNASSTGLTINFDVGDSNSGSVFVILLGGGSNRPTISISG
jgi:hypothetical protein